MPSSATGSPILVFRGTSTDKPLTPYQSVPPHENKQSTVVISDFVSLDLGLSDIPCDPGKSALAADDMFPASGAHSTASPFPAVVVLIDMYVFLFV
jgi:hypothetical protein